MRAVRCDEPGQLFFGPVFLKDQLKRDDPGAFSELFELLSGKSQGKKLRIEKSYKKAPFEVRPSSNPALFDPPSTAQAMAISTTNLDFSRQKVDTTGVFQKVTVTNRGKGELHVIVGVMNGRDFRVEGSIRRRLTGGESCSISINFTPTAAGKCTGSLRISDGAGGRHEVNLTGTGVQ